MNYWSTLETPPTRDRRAIKKAYTRLLRKYPPETDPDGFQRLRAAYDTALAMAQFEIVETDEILTSDPGANPDPGDDGIDDALTLPSGTHVSFTPSVFQGTIQDALPGETDPGPGQPIVLQSAPIQEAHALLNRIEQDFSDHGKRQSPGYWREILDSETLWNLDAKAYLGRYLFILLGRKNLDARESPTEVHIPKEAWLLLDGTFGWLENEVGLYTTTPEELVDAVLDPIRSAKGQKMAAELQSTGSTLQIDSDKSGSNRAWVYGLPFLGWALIHLIRECSR